MIIQRLLRGVSPVLEVPFHDDESVDYDGFSEVVAHSLGTGVTSVMFPGFASEFLSSPPMNASCCEAGCSIRPAAVTTSPPSSRFKTTRRSWRCGERWKR